MKSYISKKRYMFKNDQHLSLLNFIIFGLLFLGYLLEFIIFKDWSFLYLTALAPLFIGVIYLRKGAKT